MGGDWSRKKEREAEAVTTLAKEVKQALENGGVTVQICGSLRRGTPRVGDVDMVVNKVLSDVVKVLEVAHGAELMSNMEKSKKAAHVLIEDVQFDLYYADPEEWGAMVLFLTGSKLFNILMRVKAKEQGYKLNQYGLWHGVERIAGRTEEQMFYALGMDYWTPESRSISGKPSVRL